MLVNERSITSISPICRHIGKKPFPEVIFYRQLLAARAIEPHSGDLHNMHTSVAMRDVNGQDAAARDSAIVSRITRSGDVPSADIHVRDVAYLIYRRR